MLTRQKFNKVFWLQTLISETVNRSIITNTISRKCATSPFRWIYVNCFNILRFLAEVSTKLQKMHFLDNLRTIILGGKIETRQMTPFIPSAFSALIVCGIHFWIWKYSKFVFMSSPLWSILVCKIPQFLAKSHRFGQLIILFQKVDTLRLLKICILFFPPAGAKSSFFRLMD